MADAPIRAPRSLAEAQRLCEAFAAVDTEIAAIEEARDVAIAAANAEVDKDLAPLLVRREAIKGKLGPWFVENAALLTKGKRKSAELGGVVLGTREGREQLTISGDEQQLRDTLVGLRWAKPLLRVSVALDRVAIARALEGINGPKLKALGVSILRGEAKFFIERTKQAGTQAKVQP